MQITRTSLREFRAEFLETVKELQEKYGVSFDMGSVTFSQDEFHFKVTVRNLNENGEKVDPEAEAFKRRSHVYQIDPGALGKSFESGNIIYTITGLNERRRKYPISAKDEDGRIFKFTASSIRGHFPIKRKTPKV